MRVPQVLIFLRVGALPDLLLLFCAELVLVYRVYDGELWDGLGDLLEVEDFKKAVP